MLEILERPLVVVTPPLIREVRRLDPAAIEERTSDPVFQEIQFRKLQLEFLSMLPKGVKPMGLDGNFVMRHFKEIDEIPTVETIRLKVESGTADEREKLIYAIDRTLLKDNI